MADTFSFEEAQEAPDAAVNARMGEGIDRAGVTRVSTATQKARDEKAALLKTKYEGPGGSYVKEPETFSFEDAQTDAAPAPAVPKKKGAPQIPLGPADMLFGTETADYLAHHNVVASAYKFVQSKMKLAGAINELRQPDDDGVTPIEREIARRKAAGEPTDPRTVEEWVDTEARRKVFGEDKPDVPAKEQLKQVYQAAVNNPAGFAKDFVLSAVAHPEYLLAGPVGGIAMIAGESALEQQGEAGRVDANKLLVDTALGAAPVLAIHGGVRLANLRAAKERNVPPTAQAEEVALKAINDQVKEQVAEGADATVAAEGALDNVLQHMQIKPEERAAIIEGVRDASEPKGKENQVSDGEGVREGQGQESILREREQGLDQGSDAPRIEPQPVEPRTEVEPAAALQAGRADPKTLALLALPGVGAAAGYWLGNDQSDAIRKAIIGGGLGLGAAMLGKTMGAVSRTLDGLKDTRYRITHLTDDYGRGVALGELSSMRLAHSLNAILPDAKLREQVLHAVQAGDLEGLTPSQLEYAKVLRKAFDKGGEMGQAAGILPENLLKDYVTQLWVRGLNTKDSLIENLKNAMTASAQQSPGMAPRTRFSKQRSIPNYKAGIEAGLVPVTLDPSAILQVYLNNVNKAIQNQKLIGALKNERNNLGEPIVAGNEALQAEVTRRATRDMQDLPIEPAAKKMVSDIMGIKAPGDYVFINHPQLASVKVHPDVVAPLKALFDSNDANAATRAALALSIAAKRGIFSFSLFHAKSLFDALAGTSPAGWVKVPSALKMLREGGVPALDDLVGTGLKVVQRPLEADASAFSNALRVLEAKNPLVAMPAKGIRWVQEHMDQFLWGVVHPSFKVATALAAYEKGLRNPKLTKEQAASAAVSYTNDIFGGLDWFKLADGVENKYGRDLALAMASPSGRRFMQIAMLAPDWTVSTTRAMAKALPGVSAREIGALHRGYVFRSALVYLAVADGLNQAFSGHHLWDNKDPTMVDMGDGRRMQLSKHFMEPVHWLTKPGQQLMNKLGYLPKEVMTQATNQQYVRANGQAPPIVDATASLLEGIGARAKHAVKGMLPIPGTVAAEQGAGPAISGMLGVPIYGKTEQQAVDAAVERALRVYPDQPKKAASAEKRTRKRYEKDRKEQDARSQ